MGLRHAVVFANLVHGRIGPMAQELSRTGPQGPEISRKGPLRPEFWRKGPQDPEFSRNGTRFVELEIESRKGPVGPM